MYFDGDIPKFVRERLAEWLIFQLTGYTLNGQTVDVPVFTEWPQSDRPPFYISISTAARTEDEYYPPKEYQAVIQSGAEALVRFRYGTWRLSFQIDVVAPYEETRDELNDAVRFLLHMHPSQTLDTPPDSYIHLVHWPELSLNCAAMFNTVIHYRLNSPASNPPGAMQTEESSFRTVWNGFAEGVLVGEEYINLITQIGLKTNGEESDLP